MLRSCYECDVTWDAEGDRTGRIRWYFVEPNAKLLDEPTAFCSDIWSPGKYSTVAIGEIWNSDRPHTNGKPLGPYNGQHEPCGKPEWYLTGAPPEAPVLPQNALHQALCCIPSSGLLIGGTSVVRIRYINSGGIEPGGTSSLYSSYPSTGGIEPGGTASLRTLTELTGGIRPGGTSTLRTLDFPTGGILPGGTSELVAKGSYYGGILVGGTSTWYIKVPYAGYGGLLLGGTSTMNPSYITYGGIQPGGTSLLLSKTTGTGGIEPGGTCVEKTKAPVTGGIKIGGTSVYQIKLTDSCCGATLIPGVIQIAAPMAIGGTFLAKFNNTTGKWQGTDSGGHAWTLQCVAGTYQLRETISTCTATSTQTSKTCSPFSLVMHIILAGCAQAGNYIVNITAHTSPT